MKAKKEAVEFVDFLKNYCSEEWVFLVKNFIQEKKYKKGDRIFSEGERVEGVYFINSGKVKVVSHFNFEEERILRLSSRGNFLGHRAFNSEIFPVSGIALTDSRITLIPSEIYAKLVKSNPEFSFYLLEFFAEDLRNTELRLTSIIHSDVIVRIAIILCMLIDAYGYDLEKPKLLSFMLSRSDIAIFAGTSYESVIRNLTKLEEMGLVKIVGKNLMILKEKELRKLLNNKEA